MAACINTFVLSPDHIKFEKVFNIILSSMIEKRLVAGKISINQIMDADLVAFLELLATNVKKQMFAVFTKSDVFLAALSLKYPSIGFIKVITCTDLNHASAKDIEDAAPFIDTFPSRVDAYKNLYIGSKNHAMSLEILDHIGVDLVINCTRNIPNYFETLDIYTDRIIDYIRVPINDIATEDICKYFDVTSKRIQQALDSGRTVFVHCKAGVSRSASIVIAHLIKNEKMSFAAANAKVMASRPCINPNMAFSTSLVAYDKKSNR